jgi:acyl dehydratase
MALNLDSIGKIWGPCEFSYNERDLILYALGIGFTREDLEYVYEGSKDFQAFPTFGSLIPHSFLHQIVSTTQVNFARSVHGEQTLEIHNPLPRTGPITFTGVIEGIYDKGSGALIVMRFDSQDKNGTRLCTNWSNAFIRGAGGFGGMKQPKKEIPSIPPRNPDFILKVSTDVNQAVLYRLSGDLNPLHIDPAVARAVGFQEPIFHGLGTFGVVCRPFVQKVLKERGRKLRSYSARFTSPVMPGDSLQINVWEVRTDFFLLEAHSSRGEAVLKNGVIEAR